jgi:D-alanyl-D-alanine carboxypeptidase/D-alanyl-D-alanine-endopeptidase (penicillin-binding protein 4)
MMVRKRAAYVLVAVLCTAAAVWLLNDVRPVQAAQSAHDAPTLDRATRPIRPLWSPRRVPSVLRASVQATLRDRASVALTKVLSAVVAPVHACVAVNGASGALVRVDTNGVFAPASTLKLLTGTAAIRRLGADHRFVTKVVADGAGNLVLVGGGDPLLATPGFIAGEHAGTIDRDTPLTPLSRLADAIVAAGVRHVDGALVVDDHLEDAVRFLPAWKPSYAADGEIGALGALTVDRGYAPGTRRPAADPAVNAGEQLVALLAARGVTVAGGVQRGRAPADAREVAHVDSQPLSTIVEEMLTISDNYAAEELLRALAVSGGVVPGTSAAGAQVAMKELKALGVPTTGLVMLDGSGLARDDRVSCGTMLGLVDRMAQQPQGAIDRGLAVWGRTGTLANRAGADSVIGRLRAKTGSIDGAVGLVGVVDGPDRLRFAFLANGDFSEGGGRNLQAAVANAVGSAPNLQVPANLVPRP